MVFMRFRRRCPSVSPARSCSPRTVFQTLGHTADGGGAHAGLAADIGVVGSRREHTRGLEALGNIQDLLDGAGVLKEGVALVSVLQGQDGVEQGVHVGIVKRFHGVLADGLGVSFITLVW